MTSELPRIGKYDTRRVLGQGAMGTVYEGWDPDIERRVAIKTIRKDVVEAEIANQFMARFRNEAKAAGRLHHPHIVAVYEYGDQGPLAYIVMEYVEGSPLREYLAGRGSFDFGTMVELLSQLLDALALAHARGIVHRDIKPANLIVTREGVLKVADFGVARIDRSSLTTAGMLIGTPSYMSPEQCMGLEADARSDLFSTGVVLYELIAGRKPFAGSIESLGYQICREEPAPPSRWAPRPLPPAVDRLVGTALAKRPEDRFQSAQAFKEALQQVARMPVDTQDTEGATLVDIGGFALQVPSGAWDDATLDTAERELARIVGPLAKILVRKAAAQTQDRTELCAILETNIPDHATRERFRQSVTHGSQAGTHPAGSPPGREAKAASGIGGAAAPSPPPQNAVALDPAYVERVAACLAVHVGPIARVMASRAAAKSFSREDFVRLCGESLEGEARRSFASAAAHA